MVRMAAIVGLALAASMSNAAAAASDEVVVVGVPDGRLAAPALIARDYEKAARRLAPMWPEGANDPARLINLGNAYAGLGRMKDAREAYRSARFAPESTLLLANGEAASSRDVARRALGRLEASYAMR
ncbi:tetratricopeptide repeat protein [Sphingobium agri]|jgi:cytochrome c-type biogenesis protein CcmH/NrfG|uniref:Tetratricopeptide repeat protein n=1 Tax=Sphingobium agri TaxID=2933566 RepID=A0ABT0DVG9_9SPHN|nr:tetratricopeptide repeat protein [Sphingobium agri]MCK0531108.1 tetratricopeptide repeat protein [Sphingobium agri]